MQTYLPAPEEPRTASDAEALEKRCRDQELLLRAIQDHLPIVVWRIDRQGVCLHHDGKGLAAVGLTPGQFLGANLLEMYSPEDVAFIRRALEGETTYQTGEGHGNAWATWAIPVRDESGEVVGVIGATLDNSETKEAEQELRAKLEVIEQQQRVIRELSTPIIQVWDKVLTLPMVGVIDSSRTAEVMDNLLDAVSHTQARFAILDLTGVEAVDTKTAAYLIELVRAIRLLGAEGVVTGIRPSVAQTIVAIGVDLGGIVTLSNLQAGLRYCIVQMRRDAPGLSAAGR
jgi:rsbT co-antagonist protein RsbR